MNSRLSKGLRTADFQRLFSEHADALLVFLAYRCGDRGLAEDVLSDTFERALRAREIAGITGERRTTAEGRLYRGLARLRHRMVEQAVAE